MNIRLSWLPLLLLLAWPVVARAAEPARLHPKLEAFRPYLGRTWRGVMKDSTAEKPKIDISRWERALNGQAIRILHSINDGAYGGETIIVWDEARQSIVFHYFTTAGFQTTGTMTLVGGVISSQEKVVGNSGGITEVRAIGELRPDGTMSSKSEYLKNGAWTPGHEVVYREDPKAEVRFK